MERLVACRFEPLEEAPLPASALVWTSQQYFDGAGWAALPNREKVEMRPTRWADARLRFLDPIDTLPDAFKTVQSGNFDVKCWSKDDCHLGIEGDKSVFIKTPNSQEVAVYVHPERLPTFPKTWKPLVFLLNSSAATFRLTENLCLVLVRDHDKTMHISCVDYNGGFACAHPATDLAVAYGSYAVKGFEKLEKCDVIPKMATMSGDWGFYIQFFAWGMLVIPKIVELTRPQSVLGAVGMGKRVETIGLIFHPPNMFIQVRLEIPPKTTRTVEFGKDFRVTAKKSSETDIDVYLIIDGQLAKYNYSFDIRVNKPDKPKHNDHIEFKCMIEADDKKKPDAKYKVTPCKNSALLLGQGSPCEPGSAQLVSEEVIAFFDAEICMYYTHPPALKLTKAFKDVATMCEQ